MVHNVPCLTPVCTSTLVIMQGMHELCQPERVFQDPRKEEGLMEAQFIWGEEKEVEEEVEEEETAAGACTATSSSSGFSRGKSWAVGFSSASGGSLAATPVVLIGGHHVGPARGQQQRQPWTGSRQPACG